MGNWKIHSGFLVATLAFTAVAKSGDDERALTQEETQFFESKIRPVLIEHCYRCHSADGQGLRGGLGVDSRDALQAGGESGPAVVPNNLRDSTLWSAINYEDFRMPPKGKLPQNVIEDFRKWIEMGAPDPRVSTGVVIHSKVTPEDIAKGREFWAFVPPKRVAPQLTHSDSTDSNKESVNSVPRVETSDAWARTEIDRYIATKWNEQGITPNRDCEPNVLIRRLYFDLIGLPPTVEASDRFAKAWAQDPDAAVSSVVDELLGSQQFGERWGRHWLDVARYAESSGKENESTFPHAWRYRNYVIDSFNRDKPYDQFLREQIAGDLLPAKSDAEWNEHLVATGFLALGPKSLSEQNPRQFQADLVDEQIDTTTRVILGVSVACARCHDHKFDPIPQTDYYALAGIFQSTETLYGGTRSIRNRQPSNLLILPVEDPNPLDKPISATELAELKKLLKEKQQELIEARRSLRTGAQNTKSGPNPQVNVGILDQVVAQINAKLNSVDENGKPISFCMGVQDADQIRAARLLVRGEIDQPAQEVERGFVQVIGEKRNTFSKKSSGRRELADWLTSRDNPLTARVMVNRTWQHLIGRAIVREPDNFGASGPAPTHPELLDFLAIELMDNHWSLKSTIRSIATSRVYRLSSQYDKEQFEKDPENNYISRGNVRRLDAEAIRDAMLAISGLLELKPPKSSLISSFGSVVIGPNGPQALPLNLVSMGSDDRQDALRALLRSGGRNQTNPFELPDYHRSVYLPIARNSLPRALDLFDFAEPSLVVGTREVSNTAEQALFMLNNPFVLEQSDALARRLLKQTSDQKQRVRFAFKSIYGRDATNAEIAAAEKFFRKGTTSNTAGSKDELGFKLLSQFCQALFGAAEFRLVD